MPKVDLDATDRILIALVDKATKAGVGRSFKFRHRTMKVLDVNEKTIRITDGYEELELPRNVREIANKVAMLMGRIS